MKKARKDFVVCGCLVSGGGVDYENKIRIGSEYE
jgi:hypothetical protein